MENIQACNLYVILGRIPEICTFGLRDRQTRQPLIAVKGRFKFALSRGLDWQPRPPFGSRLRCQHVKRDGSFSFSFLSPASASAARIARVGSFAD